MMKTATPAPRYRIVQGGLAEFQQHIDEADRDDQDDHGEDPRLEVVQVGHLQPGRQRQRPPSARLAHLGHEQLIEAERGDHERGPDQVQVDFGEEQPQIVHGERLADDVVHEMDHDHGAVDERANRGQQQDHDREQHGQLGQRQPMQCRASARSLGTTW